MTGNIDRRSLLAGAGIAFAVGATDATAAATRTRTPIRLSLNESAVGPSPTVARALDDEQSRLARYVDQSDVDALARQIARLERVNVEQVVIGEVLEPLGLFLAQRHREGSVVYSTPGYTALIDAAAAFGGRGIAVPLDNSLQNDLAGLASAVSGDTFAVSLVNPHNPSGTVNDIAAFDAFVRAVQQRTLVIVDEAYLEYDDLGARSAVRFVREGANVLVFRTLAKAYGLAGLSIGYALAPAALAGELKRAGIGAPHSLNRLSLAAAGAALADQAHIARVRTLNLRERERVSDAVRALELRQTDSRANFVFFDAGSRADRLRAAFDRERIDVGRRFAPLDNWIRITIGAPRENDAVISVLRRSTP